MARISLAKLLGQKNEAGQVLSGLAGSFAPGLTVLDEQGLVLFGPGSGSDVQQFPVELDGQVLGSVAGSPAAQAVANLLVYLARQENEKKSLVNELVDRYREISMLYHLTEKMAASPEPEAIAQIALGDAQRLIKADAGVILLVREPGEDLQIIASFGVPYPFRGDACIVLRILQTGKAELANGISAEDCLPGMDGQRISVIGAPVKTEQRLLGVILLVGDANREFTAGDLKILSTIGLQVAPALEITRLYQVAIEKARFERELQMARQVQESLLPRNLPEIPGWNIATRWHPAREVSGDFYDILIEHDRPSGTAHPRFLNLVIADVTDKGMPASLFMAFTRSVLRASIRSGLEPASIIRNANRSVFEDSHKGLWTTLIYARLDLQTGAMTYVNAGHNPPLLYHADCGEVEMLVRTGLPLGVDIRAPYDQKTVYLQPGDRLLLYTDGITESFSPAREEFGEERLEQGLVEMIPLPVEDSLDQLLMRMDEFTGHAHSLDDVTLLAIQRLE